MKLSEMEPRERSLKDAPARPWLGLSGVFGAICLVLFVRHLPDLADDGWINQSPARQEAHALWLDQQASRLRQTIEEKERRMTPEQRAARQRRRERLRRLDRKASIDCQTFRNVARRSDAAEFRLVAAAMRGIHDHDLAVMVENDWHAQPRAARLRMARSLWRTWARIHAPANPDSATISLWDQRRYCVGASQGRGSQIAMRE